MKSLFNPLSHPLSLNRLLQRLSFLHRVRKAVKVRQGRLVLLVLSVLSGRQVWLVRRDLQGRWVLPARKVCKV